MSSSGSSRSTTSRNLHLLQFTGPRGGCDQHWAFFVPSVDGSPEGKIVHIRVNKDTRQRVVSCTVHLESFTPTRTRSRFRAFVVPGAVVLASRLKRAGDEVHGAFFSGNSRSHPGDPPSYHMVTNNCQHFCYLVLKNLNWNLPDQVPGHAIDYVESESTPLLAVRQILDTLRRQQDPFPRPIFEADGRWWRYNPMRQQREYWDERNRAWFAPVATPRASYARMSIS
ncbi:uncharacterized protein FFB20_08159 [Fusarium fujikuroi]|uniref:PPPDE domain-containing protein n=2 Tax=Fusarium fujikuroi TaxID=5127 RepID=S0EBG1_GIBF5|nr:uncharacterized protein FFUJ_08875 [Fusarium fujikuroi IMI 58289]KLP10520.1 uncharacterized protein Y057_3727 [Fusarium fujikuroi]CCT71082.1 uncharacterized protein FFUJ_08875 [Fusarium fujikuroi IMI 58289]SCN87970.1 uncharacterized protein FFB20_08159 [Fusarium fujikuroi]SCO02100.1 uncharacterized protein FFM5_07753 [Fusarium fujikuroi]SCO21102.1 uncharacterized protein FFC1_13969 [Fusarium fujikuroi]